MSARALWTCPECGEKLVAVAISAPAARNAMVDVVQEHLAFSHATTRDLTNAAAQAGGWLSSAGHQVTLWGGPHDGADLVLPLGELPPVIAVGPQPGATASSALRVTRGRGGGADYLLARTATRVPPTPARYEYDGGSR